ncbi:cyclodeaminase/cyclohydrolase family protein [Selenihalanaerobacter shriftii]|uniref:Formimidoyltetrahydrofolate cyclodeaminase n=1 Tax=Selenihalanaerobacter shriftii TaxID=142842 RepID=A0A1T4MPR5_9FIRM|nr:cyclodeaminase/cyclohydrolase family protein [Selenihalanaerobacter shriftii]SJZ69039.1 Formimidoyltetrahydrofolate cyclodeaminase [Selenihalanaerobacter shriftii]
MSFSDYTLEEFVNELGSKSSTPGGGSTAGLGGALASSLALMVIKLTKDSDLDKYTADLNDMKSEALELIDEDSESFDKVMSAFKLPKETEEEKEERSKEIQKALKGASITPLNTMKLGLKVLEIAKEVAKEGNPNAASDVGVAGLMALSTVKGGSYNVLINAQSLKDEKVSKELKDEANDIIAKAEKLANEIEEITASKISG